MSFRKNVLVLLSGTSIAQAITVVSSPVLTRIFSPSDYGTNSLFNAISSIISQNSCGRYELAVILPEKDRDGFSIFALSSLIVVCIAAVSMVVLGLFNKPITALLENPAISVWLYAIPLAVVLRGVYLAATCWHNRKQRYEGISRNRIIGALIAAAASIAMGFAGFGLSGLIIGGLLSQTVSLALFLYMVKLMDSGYLAELNFQNIREQAARYVNFPKYLLVSGLVETASGYLPQIVISSFFGSATLGFFSLAMNVSNMPLSLISTSIGEVFRQTASKVYAEQGNCRRIFVDTFKRLLVIAVIPFLVLFAFAPYLFSVFFGAKWVIAGEYARIMAVMVALRLVSSPLSTMFYIAEKVRWDLIIQTCLFILVLSSMIIIHKLGKGAETAVLAYTGIYSAKYIVELGLSYKFCLKREHGSNR